MASLITNLAKTLLPGSNKKSNETKIINKKYEGSWADTNSSYSACDMVATISIRSHTGKTLTVVLGELQTLSYSIHQEKAPVRMLGNINPRMYVCGPRTIAGSLVFAVFNKHWMEDIYKRIETDSPMKNTKFITDEIPVFDIVISFSNEYGFESYLSLSSVSIINEGQVMSSSDIYIENTFQYVAQDIQLLRSSASPVSSVSKKRPAVVSASKSGDKKEESKTSASQLSTKNTIKTKPIAVKEDTEEEGKT